MREAGCINDDLLRQAYCQLARLWNKMADEAGSANHVEGSEPQRTSSCGQLGAR
jgi:hypothetical protein